ncbi:hypothetical protein CY35_19G072600 [Sphagnum magellanicum]|nr:hypothetical protein CY35_19G072600 [Sphagnum magellanicum]
MAFCFALVRALPLRASFRQLQQAFVTAPGGCCASSLGCGGSSSFSGVCCDRSQFFFSAAEFCSGFCAHSRLLASAVAGLSREVRVSCGAAVCVPGLAGSDARFISMVAVQQNVRLTASEQGIFELLLSTLRHFRMNTQLRVAGGWVRDKLLGTDSHDIDIAIDDMLGKEFCKKVNEYLESIGEETQGVGIIQSNPEQSKHLETARMRIRGVWVDFVNLRAETYAQHSRIPTMEFGTALEDALRRDLTINSLFYNINTCSVEDLTGKGLMDLAAGLIRTPLPPKETFLDDPLRVMRAIRFGARFGFKLEEELKNAASCEEVKEALGTKVSRERIGHEVDLMLMGKKPSEAMRWFEQLELFPVIFTACVKDSNPPLLGNNGRLCVDYMQAAGEVLAELEGSQLTMEERRLCFLSALLLPFRHHTHPYKKGSVPVSDIIIKDSLKLKSDDAKNVLQLHAAAEQFTEVTKLLSQNDVGTGRQEVLPVDGHKRVQPGLCLHQIKGLWRTALVLSTLLPSDLDQISPAQRAHQFRTTEDAILKLGLDKVWTQKPLLDGKKIMELLDLQRGVPQMKEWMDQLQKWELAHPEGSQEEIIEWFNKEHAKRFKANG